MNFPDFIGWVCLGFWIDGFGRVYKCLRHGFEKEIDIFLSLSLSPPSLARSLEDLGKK